MSKITLTNDDGSTVEFTQVVPVAEPVVTENEQVTAPPSNPATGSEVADTQTETPEVAAEDTVAEGESELPVVEN